MAKIEDIEGIGPAYAASLGDAGIKTVERLLEASATRQGRSALATTTGISETHLLSWANRADLMRIPGIGTQFSDLLEAAGVDSVPELARRNAENLHARMSEINSERNLVNRLPSMSEVGAMITEAKGLPTIVSH